MRSQLSSWARICVRQHLTGVDIIKLLDIKALPYVLFLIVPILGRMSDPDEHVRLLSTSTFASLIKMVPLEVSYISMSRSPYEPHGALDTALMPTLGWDTRSTQFFSRAPS